MALVFAYHQKYPLRQLVLKTDVTLVQTLQLIIPDCFTWKSFFGDRHLYLDAIRWQLKSDMIDLTHAKTMLNLFYIVYVEHRLIFIVSQMF